MSRCVGLACALLLPGCCLFATEQPAGVADESSMDTASSPESDRAAAVAVEYVAAIRRGDRTAALELTDPGQRKWLQGDIEDSGSERWAGMESDVRLVSSLLGAETLDNWAIVGFRVPFDDHPEVLMYIAHRVDGQWYVGSSFVSGLTEVFNLFNAYPDPPSEELYYMPARRFTSRLWKDDPGIPSVPLDRKVEIPLDGGDAKRGRWLKFSVRGATRVRIAATTLDDAGPSLELEVPTGGSRGSWSSTPEKGYGRYSQGPREALIEHEAWNATYLVRVRASTATTVHLRVESTETLVAKE